MSALSTATLRINNNYDLERSVIFKMHKEHVLVETEKETVSSTE